MAPSIVSEPISETLTLTATGDDNTIGIDFPERLLLSRFRDHSSLEREEFHVESENLNPGYGGGRISFLTGPCMTTGYCRAIQVGDERPICPALPIVNSKTSLQGIAPGVIRLVPGEWSLGSSATPSGEKTSQPAAHMESISCRC